MKTIKPEEWNQNAFQAIGKEWMLVTAGTPDNFNTMTASWGGIGVLWGKPVAFVFIRPERHTFQFIEQNPRFTLTFLGEENRKIYNFCGSKSGREYDKIKETGLKPITLESNTITYEQAHTTLVCRKLYAQDINPDSFIDKAQLERWYNDKPGGGLHRMYVVEIEEILEK